MEQKSPVVMTGDKKNRFRRNCPGEFIHGNAIRMKKIGVLLNNNFALKVTLLLYHFLYRGIFYVDGACFRDAGKVGFV